MPAMRDGKHGARRNRAGGGGAGTVLLGIVFAAACVNWLVTSALAEVVPYGAAWLSRQDVAAVLVGQRVDGIYTDGRQWSELMTADGATVLAEDGRSIAGRWHFDDEERLCFAYAGESPPVGACFRYVRIGPNCLEHFFQETEGVLAGQWVTNGRLWRSAEPSTCEERSISRTPGEGQRPA